MSRVTLITPQEVINHSPVGTNFDRNLITSYIPMKEEKIFRTAFDLDYYQKLKDALVDYSSAEPFDHTRTYDADDAVVWNGQVWVATEPVDPGEATQPRKEQWKTAPKFSVQCYEDLWCLYLCQLIAWQVLYTSAVTTSIRMESKGMVRNFTQDSSPATHEELAMWKKEMFGDAQDIFDNMAAYIKANPECFPEWTSEDECEDAGPTKQKRYPHGFVFD